MICEVAPFYAKKKVLGYSLLYVLLEIKSKDLIAKIQVSVVRINNPP